jgi:hypothetical protein|tara:strand:+ start:6725 stop:6949 length:225 start_codon:yes stop_codon:yes gene_type:complete
MKVHHKLGWASISKNIRFGGTDYFHENSLSLRFAMRTTLFESFISLEVTLSTDPPFACWSCFPSAMFKIGASNP